MALQCRNVRFSLTESASNVHAQQFIHFTRMQFANFSISQMLIRYIFESIGKSMKNENFRTIQLFIVIPIGISYRLTQYCIIWPPFHKSLFILRISFNYSSFMDLRNRYKLGDRNPLLMLVLNTDLITFRQLAFKQKCIRRAEWQ